jgi:hypothetical protein
MESIKEIYNRKISKKPPAYAWQDLALRIIGELDIPAFKKNSVFKICKENNKIFVEHCLNDTKELCLNGLKWKYFFKIAASKGNNSLSNNRSRTDIRKKVF